MDPFSVRPLSPPFSLGRSHSLTLSLSFAPPILPSFPVRRCSRTLAFLSYPLLFLVGLSRLSLPLFVSRSLRFSVDLPRPLRPSPPARGLRLSFPRVSRSARGICLPLLAAAAARPPRGFIYFDLFVRFGLFFPNATVPLSRRRRRRRRLGPRSPVPDAVSYSSLPARRPCNFALANLFIGTRHCRPLRNFLPFSRRRVSSSAPASFCFWSRRRVRARHVFIACIVYRALSLPLSFSTGPALPVSSSVFLRRNSFSLVSPSKSFCSRPVACARASRA